MHIMQHPGPATIADAFKVKLQEADGDSVEDWWWPACYKGQTNQVVVLPASLVVLLPVSILPQPV
jgi:hypothetical protein